jgi:hypothetical protein
MWTWTDRVVICEIDENGGHVNYASECDLGWVMDMNSALIRLFQKNNYNDMKMPHLFVIRFNPDEYDGGKVSLDDRIKNVAKRIRFYLNCDLTDFDSSVPTVEYHYYHTKCNFHINYARSSLAVNVLKICI